MKKIIKKAFRPGKLLIASGLLAFLILLSTQKVLADTNNKNPYLIKVNRYYNTITVYAKDKTGYYNIPIKAITCSVGQKGTETVLGTFQTKAKYRWKELMGKVYGQYSTRIVGGILFHSVYYYEYGNPASLAVREYNKLGSPASHGCIRLTVEDAKWIYDNCPVGTTVTIFDDKKSPGPLGKPKTMKLPTSVRWDPTDPSKKNPYKDKKPKIYGAKSQSIDWGLEVDLLEGITAKSTVGLDITSSLVVDGSINTYRAGDYKITYKVTDALGRSIRKTTTVTVEESPSPPRLEGIRDYLVRGDTEITREFALSGVKAYCDNIRLNEEEIEVTIERMSEEEYLITYVVNVGDDMSDTAYASIILDREAPVFTGVSERILNPGQLPDRTYCLSGVAVNDNHTSMNLDDITIRIQEIYGEIPEELAEDVALDNNNTEHEDDVDRESTELDNSTGDISEMNDSEDSTGLQNNLQEDISDSIQNPNEEVDNAISYLITYEASDEVGNVTEKTVVFHY